MSKISKIINPLLKRPKCFAHLYHPSMMMEVCNCGPPPAVINPIPSDYLFIPDDERICYNLNDKDDYDKVA